MNSKSKKLIQMAIAILLIAGCCGGIIGLAASIWFGLPALPVAGAATILLAAIVVRDVRKAGAGGGVPEPAKQESAPETFVHSSVRSVLIFGAVLGVIFTAIPLVVVVKVIGYDAAYRSLHDPFKAGLELSLFAAGFGLVFLARKFRW